MRKLSRVGAPRITAPVHQAPGLCLTAPPPPPRPTLQRTGISGVHPANAIKSYSTPGETTTGGDVVHVHKVRPYLTTMDHSTALLDHQHWALQ